ncbi:MAG: hypothetical protein JSR98_09735, partial [Proteobacteria bacterium]|nr:hypothetical protein [Pseudomonadota bacterium]
MQQQIAAYLVNAAWQIPLVAACAFGVTRFAGLSPRARNGVWLAFLAAAAILPAVSLKGLIPRPAPVVARVAVADPMAAALPLYGPDEPMLVKAALPVTTEAETAAPAGIAAPIALTPAIAWTMSGLVATFALLLAARLATASLAARRLVREARPAALPHEAVEALGALALAHGRRAPPVLESPAVRS